MPRQHLGRDAYEVALCRVVNLYNFSLNLLSILFVKSEEIIHLIKIISSVYLTIRNRIYMFLNNLSSVSQIQFTDLYAQIYIFLYLNKQNNP